MLYLLREGQEKALALEPSNQGFTEGELKTLVNCLPELLGEDLFILNYEFGGFTPSGNRAGILALNRLGKKFIVELRQGDADATELKALEYAATYSRATVADLADIYAGGKAPDGGKISSEAALAELKQYLDEGVSNNGGLDGDPAIVVFASGFRPEFHTTAMWLKDRGVNISCVRFRGYHVEDSWVIDVEHDAPFVARKEHAPEVTRKPAEPRPAPAPAPAPAPPPPTEKKKQAKAETVAEAPAAKAEPQPEPPQPQPVDEDDPSLRYPLLSKVKALLADWRPELEVESYPDALVFPTTQDNIYFAMSAHTYPDPMIEVGLRFERESLNFNRAVAKRVLEHMEQIEADLGESLDVQDPWYRSWVRLSVRRDYDPYSTTQAAEAAEIAAKFVDVLLPLLNSAMDQTMGVEAGAVAKPA
jgi:hypothetical protein